MSAHLLRLSNAVNVKNCWRDVVNGSFETHQAKFVLDTRSHRKKRTRDIVAVGEIMFGDYRRGLLVVHVGVGISFFKFAQWLDSMVGDDEHIGILVNVV